MSGKVVLITGGANGIGAATGAELARRGWVPVAADIEATGDTIPLDVTDPAACEQAVETVLDRHGRLDAVWANAGIASFGPLGATDPDAWRRTLDVNLIGAFNTIRAALPAVTGARGYVAVTASLASFAHGPGLSAYSASKAGVEAMCNSLRIELAHRGVAVGTIHPTWIDTDMVREADGDVPAFDRFRSALRPPFRKTYPVERAAREIADGFDRRARRVCTPGFVRLAHLVRAASTTRMFERDLIKAVPDLERLFDEQVAEHGALHSSLGERERNRLSSRVD
jgi:NAD(P)-dependent dehydrogenase (short-subunit alcohol dehydrogenase family)